MPDPTPGIVVRARREALSLTREELARLSGTSTSTVARLELRNHLPNVRSLTRIAAVLDVSLTDLVPAEKAAS